MCGKCKGKRQNALPVTAKEDQSKAILAIYTAEKDVLAALLY